MITLKKIILNNQDWNYILINSLLFFGLLPFFLTHDFWDGAIISYGSSMQDLSGIKFWFFQSGWHLQYFQILTFHELSNVLSVSYIAVNKLIVFIFSILFLREMTLISKMHFHLEGKWLLALLIFLSASPVMSVLSSSVMAFHFLSLTICLIGVRWIHCSSNYRLILGYFLIFLSLSYPANLGLCIGLSYLYDCSYSKKIRYIKMLNLNIALPEIRTYGVIILALSFYVVHRLIFEPYGFWDGYYSLRNPFTLKGILVIGYRSLEFFSHFLIVGFSICLIQLINKNKIKIFSLEKFRNNSIVYIGLFVFLMSSCLSFIMVGKAASIIDIYDWSTRHALTFYIPFSIICIITVKSGLEKIQLKTVNSNIILTVALSTNIFLGAYAWNDKFQRDDFYITFREYLETDQNKLSEKIVLVKRNIRPAVRDFEYNYIYHLSNTKVDSYFTEAEFNINNQLERMAVRNFGFSAKEIKLYLKLNKDEKINFLSKEKPDLLNALNLYLVTDLSELNGSAIIDDQKLNKWYGPEFGSKFRRRLKEISDNLFPE
jgi:hypothetical protein